MASAFEQACDLVIGNRRDQSGIGTLGEKFLHAILKYMLEPDDSRHEIKIGQFYADIHNEAGIFEIQTRNLNTLRRKLDFFLKEHVVTVVFPITHQKWLVWLDIETGEAKKRRKSPRTGSSYDAFFELYKIRLQLDHPNLRLRLLLLDMVEYRRLDGWSSDKKRGSSRYERIPEKLVKQIDIKTPQDFGQLVPPDLPLRFSSIDFAKAAKISRRAAQTGLNVLNYVHAVERVGKQGNSYIYECL